MLVDLLDLVGLDGHGPGRPGRASAPTPRSPGAGPDVGPDPARRLPPGWRVRASVTRAPEMTTLVQFRRPSAPGPAGLDREVVETDVAVERATAAARGPRPLPAGGLMAGRPLTVLVDAGPWLPVPPEGYGGIENVLATLVPELRRLGVRVVLASVGTSRIEVDERVTAFDEPRSSRRSQRPTTRSWASPPPTSTACGRSCGVATTSTSCTRTSRPGASSRYADSRPAGPAHPALGPAPSTPSSTAASTAGAGVRQRRVRPPSSRARRRRCAHHALGHVHLATPLAVEPGPPVGPGATTLVVLARITPAKGQDVAARLAHRTGRRVVLAGPVGPYHAPPRSRPRWPRTPGRGSTPTSAGSSTRSSPLIDGDRVRWVGCPARRRARRLVAGAAAQLCPLQWEEPGGTGVVESLALGTPVVGYARGCLPELIDARAAPVCSSRATTRMPSPNCSPPAATSPSTATPVGPPLGVASPPP